MKEIPQKITAHRAPQDKMILLFGCTSFYHKKKEISPICRWV